MKKIFQRASLALLVASSVSVAQAADNTTFDINAEFVNDVNVVSTTNMNFGQLSVGSGGGAITIDSAGTLTVDSGDVAIVDAAAAAAAVLELTSVGGGNATLTIADATLNGVGPGSGTSLIVSNYTTSEGSLAGIAVAAGNVVKTVSVGASMNVPGSVPVDTYTGTAAVTVAMQ